MREYFMESERLLFGKWQADDIELATLLWGEAEVTRFIKRDGFSQSHIAEKLANEIASQQELGYQYWPFFLKDSLCFVGCCGLKSCVEGKAFVELGVHLRKEFWGCGYATEASQRVIEYAFSLPQVNTILAGHHPDNAASKKALQKLGFEYFGTELYPPTGLMHPVYTITKSAFNLGATGAKSLP